MSEYIKHTTMKLETIKHKDVRGKELLYLKVTNKHQEEYLINVGEKTYKEVTDLVDREGKSSDEIKKLVEEAKAKK